MAPDHGRGRRTGGAVRVIESGWIAARIADSAYRTQQRIEAVSASSWA